MTALFARGSNTPRKRRVARIAKAETDQARGIYFWHITRADESTLQFCTHVTEHTPKWCKRHKRGYAAHCCSGAAG